MLNTSILYVLTAAKFYSQIQSQNGESYIFNMFKHKILVTSVLNITLTY
jgi:hypothetical protein